MTDEMLRFNYRLTKADSETLTTSDWRPTEDGWYLKCVGGDFRHCVEELRRLIKVATELQPDAPYILTGSIHWEDGRAITVTNNKVYEMEF